MQIENKALTQLVKSVRGALKRDHSLDVPHSALRASVLLALGENPHAFAGKEGKPANELEALVKEAPHYFHPSYDFDGRKLEWLERAGLVPSREKQALPSKRLKKATASGSSFASEAHRLYLVEDDIGITEALSVDPEGLYKVPAGFDFTGGTLLSMEAELPSLKKYGLPDFVQDTGEFFRTRFSLACPDVRKAVKDLGDDSGGSCELVVHLPTSVWNNLTREVFRENPSLTMNVAEWLGLHYGRNFDAESTSKRGAWMERFLEANSQSPLPMVVSASFEWLWPDQDSDSVCCLVDLETGEIRLDAAAPEHDRSIVFRVVHHAKSGDEQYDATYKTSGAGAGRWFLTKPAHKALRKDLGL